MSEVKKGLHAYVYRSSTGDCSLNGASSRYNTFTITGHGVGPESEIFEVSDEYPEMVIVRDMCCGKERLRAIPRDALDSGKWTMFGGNFLYSSDSRFPSDAPIKIHDRIEG